MPESQTVVESDTVTKLSNHSVTETVARLTELVAARGMRLFAVIDQAAEAQKVGLELRQTIMVISGSPQLGTPVMEAVPLAALDPPLKVLIWADGLQAKVSYDAPGAVARRRGLSRGLATKFAGINGLTDELIAP